MTLMCAGDSPCVMALYPGGSHRFLESGKPSQRLDAVQRLVAWVEKWIDTPITDDGPTSGRQTSGG